ncbi:hypothetical protein [Parasphingopyxis marina]|uniref:Lipoprotein n=1 Tax=Parasphingopyxis marina TaxID=2761622 RepID=A0A842HWF4_9SPHN|nr:hypothetical protein [Parasphingopyxis marina]MBC2776747.1 hypothetical protein [Parasphingopyxis marina]
MLRKGLTLGALVGLAGCASAPTPTPTTVSRPMSVEGLERVMGRNADQLTRLFGEPVQDFREDNARKLQFASSRCVLDLYLYPQGSGRDYIVTYVDARNVAGEDVDRASCVEALSRR